MGIVAEEEGTQAIDRAARILVGLIESDAYVSLATIIEGTGLANGTAAPPLRGAARDGRGRARRGRGGAQRPRPAGAEGGRPARARADGVRTAGDERRRPRR